MTTGERAARSLCGATDRGWCRRALRLPAVGTWIILVCIAFTQTTAVPAWLGFPGIAIGALLALCVLEFVGPAERFGWKLPAKLTLIVYIAWSALLVAGGIAMLGWPLSPTAVDVLTPMGWFASESGGSPPDAANQMPASRDEMGTSGSGGLALSG